MNEGWYRPKGARKAHKWPAHGGWFRRKKKSLCGKWTSSRGMSLAVAARSGAAWQRSDLCKACLRKEAALYAKSPAGKRQAEFMAESEGEASKLKDATT